MRDALDLILSRAPELAVEGEMRADSALSKTIRDREFPDSRLTADANLLVMPNVDAANITYNALRVPPAAASRWAASCSAPPRPVHIMTPSSTVRRIVNMTASPWPWSDAQRRCATVAQPAWCTDDGSSARIAARRSQDRVACRRAGRSRSV